MINVKVVNGRFCSVYSYVPPGPKDITFYPDPRTHKVNLHPYMEEGGSMLGDYIQTRHDNDS